MPHSCNKEETIEAELEAYPTVEHHCMLFWMQPRFPLRGGY
jgi:hypothetical protein